MNQMETYEFYSGLIIKIGAILLWPKRSLQNDCPLFWEARKIENHPKQKLALVAVQKTRSRQAENDWQNKDLNRDKLLTKSKKAVTKDMESYETDPKRMLETSYQKTGANAINKMKYDLATKVSELMLRQEIEKQQKEQPSSGEGSEPEVSDNLKVRSNCNTLKMETGKPFGITKIGARIRSIITVGGHEVMKNLSEQSDQTLMHIDVHADYLRSISPQTPSNAIRALLRRGGGKSIRIDSRYTEAYGPHEVKLKIDGINLYTKTTITCDDDLACQVFLGREELKVSSIGHCAMLEEDAKHLDTEAGVSAHVLDINGKKTPLKVLLDMGTVLSVIPIEIWTRIGFDKSDLLRSRFRLSAGNKGALRLLGRTTS